jgi:two-component system chemotaxis response regulator CheY
LIADDALFTRQSLRAMLQNNGYEIAGEAGNGTIAVRNL